MEKPGPAKSKARISTYLRRRPRPHRYPLLVRQEPEQIVRRSLEGRLHLDQRPIHLLRLFLLFWRWSRCRSGCGGGRSGAGAGAGADGGSGRRRRSPGRVGRGRDEDVFPVDVYERDREFFEFDFERCGQGLFRESEEGGDGRVGGVVFRTEGPFVLYKYEDGGWWGSVVSNVNRATTISSKGQ